MKTLDLEYSNRVGSEKNMSWSRKKLIENMKEMDLPKTTRKKVSIELGIAKPLFTVYGRRYRLQWFFALIKTSNQKRNHYKRIEPVPSVVESKASVPILDERLIAFNH